MRKQLTVILLFLSSLGLSAQTDFVPGGNPIGQIFFNYRYDLTNDVDRKSSFNLERAYLGYGYNFTPSLSGKVIFDVAYDPNVRSFTAFAKNAFMDWTIAPQVKVQFGLIPLKHFELQDRIWGYRYIMKTFTDEYGMGTTADLGINFELPVNDALSFNVYAINGEGFRGIQDEFGIHKVAANATYHPTQHLWFRAHYDIMPSKFRTEDAVIDSSNISILTLFAAYEVKDRYRIGVEYNMMNDAVEYRRAAEDHQLSGISVFGAYTINPKFELFARYDQVTSNTLDNEPDQWNIARDGSLVMGGVQYKVNKGVNLAVNYRTFIYKQDDRDNTSGLFLNLGMSF